jgi:hypothetical protein
LTCDQRSRDARETSLAPKQRAFRADHAPENSTVPLKEFLNSPQNTLNRKNLAEIVRIMRLFGVAAAGDAVFNSPRIPVF